MCLLKFFYIVRLSLSTLGIPIVTNAIQGLGDKTIVKDESGERVERIGAGGWGGGVHLVTSDQETQDINRVNLERFLKKQRRLKERRERDAEQQQ